MHNYKLSLQQNDCLSFKQQFKIRPSLLKAMA